MEEIEKEFYAFKESILQYIAGLKEWQAATADYRKDLCAKIDKIWQKMEGLPCSERKGWYMSMGRQVSFMWLVLAIVLVGILSNYLMAHAERSAIKKDMDCLKAEVEYYHANGKRPPASQVLNP